MSRTERRTIIVHCDIPDCTKTVPLVTMPGDAQDAQAVGWIFDVAWRGILPTRDYCPAHRNTPYPGPGGPV